MPPRYAYWTIIAGGLPTAFRMAERDELLPTFRRIQERHPDAEMKYFARGKLWTSPEEARLAMEARRAAGTRSDARSGGAARRDWRPGGDHRDPRQTFKDTKKARNLDRRRQRFERRERGGQAPDAPREGKLRGDPLRPQAQRAVARKRLERKPDTRRVDRPRGRAGRQDRRRS
jgi:hypothetical protein